MNGNDTGLPVGQLSAGPPPGAAKPPPEMKPQLALPVAAKPVVVKKKSLWQALPWQTKLMLVWWLITLNLPAIWSVLRAARILTTGKCLIQGHSKIAVGWIMVSWGSIILVLYAFGVDSRILGLIWALMLGLEYLMFGTELTNRWIGWLMAFLSVWALVMVLLKYVWHVDAFGDVGRFLQWFKVDLQVGLVLLIGFIVMLVWALSYPANRFSNAFAIEGNRYIPHKALGRGTNCSDETHTLTNKTRDWVERGTLSLSTLVLSARYAGPSGAVDTDDEVREGHYVFENVFGAGEIARMVQIAMAAEDVESPKS